MTIAVNTRTVAEFRNLRFSSVDECVAEVQRILAAAEEGRLNSCGNWTPGQIMAHVAAWINYGYDGFPIGRPPLIVRWFLRLRLKKLLRDGMSRGVRIPGVKGGTVGMEELDTSVAAQRLLQALRRLQSEEAVFDSPAFGAMSMEDRIALNLRHAELHLGFITY